MTNGIGSKMAIAVAGLLLAGAPARLFAHCDTLDGPVVKDARAALQAKEVTPVLKWVGPGAEKEVREAFNHALGVRALGAEARALADRFFFETVVRLHRLGEGAPFTGIEPEGTVVEPGIIASDEALAAGSSEALVKMVTGEVEHGIRERFEKAAAAKRNANDSVEKGRAYVAAYVEFMHFTERLLQDATTDASHHTPAAAADTPPHKH